MFLLFIKRNPDRSLTISADIPEGNRRISSTYHGLARGVAENVFRQQFGLIGRPARRVIGEGV